MIKLKYIKRMKKLLCALMVTLIIALTVAPMSMAVEYPQGITAEQAEKAIDKTDTLIYSLLKQMENTTLKGMLAPMLYSSDTLSMLTVEVYKMLEGSSETATLLGLQTYPAAVASYLKNYPDVASALSSYSSWAEVDLNGVDWGVDSKQELANAAAAVFGPLNGLLYTLLCGGSYPMNILISINGAKGYENAIIPILRNFGCTDYTAPEVFYANAQTDPYSMVRHIVIDLFSYIEELLDTPCSKLTEYLPGIAYFINNGGLDNAIQSLISPLKVEVLIIQIPIDIQSMMSAEGSTEGFTFDLNFGDMLSVSDFQTAPLDMELLASCGTVSGDTVISNKGDTFIVVLRWLIETIKLNQGALPQMMGGQTSPEMTKIMNSVLSKPTDELVTLIISLFNQTTAYVNDYQWLFNDNPQTPVSYTPNLGQEKYQRVLEGIDKLLSEFIKESGEAGSVRQALQPQIYSNALVSQLAMEVYSMLTSGDMAQMAGLLGLDVSPSALSEELTEAKFAETRKQLSSYYSWSVVKPESITWGFKDGDRNGFIDAVTAVFRPFDELLRMVLCGGKIQLFGAIDIYGSDGYNTAIIPLLEAFGVYGENVPTFKEYASAIQKQDAIRPIVKSLTSLIERVLDKPVYTITEILPNLLYFLNNGGIEIIVKNMLHPVIRIMEQLGLSDMLDLSQMTSIDISSMMQEMMKNMDGGVALPELNLNQFQGMGQLTTVPSKRTQSGSQVMIYAVDSDQTAVLVTLLRYLVEIMKTPGNEDLITSFMGSGEAGANDMFATYSGGIAEELASMTVDETVEWLYKLFFRERAVAQEKQEDYLPTIIYKGKVDIPWGGILTSLMFIIGLGLFIGLANRDRIRILLDEYKEKKQLKAQTVGTQEV